MPGNGNAAAQESPPLDESVFRVDVNVVNVLCTVRDWQGLHLRDLRREDFRIREDGKPQGGGTDPSCEE